MRCEQGASHANFGSISLPFLIKVNAEMVDKKNNTLWLDYAFNSLFSPITHKGNADY